ATPGERTTEDTAVAYHHSGSYAHRGFRDGRSARASRGDWPHGGLITSVGIYHRGTIHHLDEAPRGLLAIKRYASNAVPLRIATNHAGSALWFGCRLWPSRPTFRTPNIVEHASRECLAIEIDHGLSGLRVTRVLDRLAIRRPLPRRIVVANGPEFTR